MPLGWCLQEINSSPSKPSSTTPTAESLRIAVAALAEAYNKPELKAVLAQVYQKMGNKALAVLPQLLLPVQAPVLTSLGLSADFDGVKVLQNAIYRRVNEGDPELRELANEMLARLGVPKITASARDMKVEDFLLQGADQGAVYSADLATTMQLPAAINALMESLQRTRQPRCPISISVLKVWSIWEQLGLPPELQLRPAEDESPIVARLENPTADELRECVMQNRPAIISGALDETAFPPLRNFADFDYLRRRCGDKPVRVKGNMCSDRDGRQVYVSDPVVSMPFAEYLDMVEKSESAGEPPSFYMGKAPISKELPELVEDIESSPSGPWKKYGSCFGEANKGIYTYFGCGRNSTSTHFDPSENLLLVVTGTKRFELHHPTDVECLYPTKPPSFTSAAVPAFTRPDDMSEDVRARFPLYEKAKPVTVDVVAGEMLYLPIFWWHGVTGSAERNMILNWWCQLHPDKCRPTEKTEGAQGVLHGLAAK